MNHPLIQQNNLNVYIELNQKYGYGFQARLVLDGIVDSVIDVNPFTLDEVLSGATYAVEEINRETGNNYDPHNCIKIAGTSIEANKGSDFTTARVARDIRQGKGELVSPIRTDDGDEIVLTGRGVILVSYFAWMDDNMPNARRVLTRYCEYLASHGYGAGAKEIMAELDRKNKDSGADWIKTSYDQYITDDVDVIQYVMQDTGRR